jgi:hypothetical protein
MIAVHGTAVCSRGRREVGRGGSVVEDAGGTRGLVTTVLQDPEITTVRGAGHRWVA